MGADHVVHVDTRNAHALAERVKSTLGCDADVTIECSGAESSIQTGIYVRTCEYLFCWCRLLLETPEIGGHLKWQAVLMKVGEWDTGHRLIQRGGGGARDVPTPPSKFFIFMQF